MQQATTVLVNLGSTAELSVSGIQAFLREFLSDKYVVDLPRFFWLPILHGFVLKKRPEALLAQYQAIWGKHDSPLIEITRALAAKMPHTEMAMRYGEPSLQSVLSRFNSSEKNITLLPLYPQYNRSTTESVFAEIARIVKPWSFTPNIRLIRHYAVHPAYIEALALHIERYWERQGKSKMLVFSFHGVPIKMIQAGDPYLSQCEQTVALLIKRLKLDSDKCCMVFQSRFGGSKWLEPACTETLGKLAKKGIKEVDIVCPGFATDCLETLYEINIENREYFLKHGGKRFNYIPALNDSDEHVRAIQEILQDASTSITLESWMNHRDTKTFV